MAGEVAAPIVDDTLFSGGAKGLQDWSNLLDSMFGKGQTWDKNEQVLTQLSSQADNPLMAMIMQLMGQASQGVNSSQIQALLGPIFQQLQTATIPGIQGAANAGGGVYNSTTQQLLKNDALARATAQGGNLVVTQQNNLQQQLQALLAILAKSTQATAQNTSGTTKQATSGSVGNIGKGIGAAAGAAGLAKAIRGLTSKPAEKFDSKGDQEGDYPQHGTTRNEGGGRSDRSDDTSGMPVQPATGSDPNDPFGVGGWDSNFGAGAEPFAEGSGSLGGADFSWINDIFGGETGGDGNWDTQGGADLGGWSDMGSSGGFGLGEGGADIFGGEGE